MDGRNISDEGGGAFRSEVSEDGGIAGSAGDPTPDTPQPAPQPTGQTPVPAGAQYAPTNANRRRDSLYVATNSAGGQFLSTEELLKRARAIDDFITGADEQPA